MKMKGFTLIELIIVIIILGILAVVAAPKFIDLQNDANKAKLDGMKSALASGILLVNSKARIQNKTNGSDILNVNGVSIELHSGYPIGSWKKALRYVLDLDNVGSTPDICDIDWCGKGGVIDTVTQARRATIFPRGYKFDDQCAVFYLNRADGTKPEIGVETNGC